MFAATQYFLTNAFCFVAVASVVGLALELAYFLASTPSPTTETATMSTPDATAPTKTPRTRPHVACVVATALTTETLASLGVVKLRKVAVTRGHRGAGRWTKAALLAALCPPPFTGFYQLRG